MFSNILNQSRKFCIYMFKKFWVKSFERWLPLRICQGRHFQKNYYQMLHKESFLWKWFFFLSLSKMLPLPWWYYYFLKYLLYSKWSFYLSFSRWVMSDSFETSWAIACQAPLSMGFPRQEYWNGLLFPSPGDLPDPENEPTSPSLRADSLPLSHQRSPRGQQMLIKT